MEVDLLDFVEWFKRLAKRPWGSTSSLTGYGVWKNTASVRPKID